MNKHLICTLAVIILILFALPRLVAQSEETPLLPDSRFDADSGSVLILRSNIGMIGLDTTIYSRYSETLPENGGTTDLATDSKTMNMEGTTTSTVTLQPGTVDGKDANVQYAQKYPDYADMNFGENNFMFIWQWTNSTMPTTARSYLEFDLSDFQDPVDITDAKLSLYHYGGTSQHGGGVADRYLNSSFYIRRITAPWQENTVTWNTQPNATTVNQVSVAAPATGTSNFENIDVTQLVKDMVQYGNNGFQIILQNETAYRSVYFGTSENTDNNGSYRPKLEITVQSATEALAGGTASPATATIASGSSPGDITCTAATGGTGTYSYQWQSSTNSGGSWTTISGATSASYTAPALTQTTWYRRKVTSGAETAYSTVSKITVSAGGGSGTVTSVALSSSDLTITGSPVTTSGTITANLATASVDATNLNDNVISGRAALASGLLSTDELFVSDGGSLKRMDVSVLESYMQSNLDFLWTENAGDISYTGGNVLVGANGAPKNLYVYGKVYSTEVVVQNSIPVPDYVFDKNYQLKPLGEVESFINKNKHLPEIPSAKEVEQNGVDLGEMNLLLLKKIEELTLYLLQQDKRISELERASLSFQFPGDKLSEGGE